jgi:hypothetical protein
MKRIIFTVLLMNVSGAAFAVAPGGPDCGWGNLLFDGQSGLGSHIIASITNGTSGNNTFGMTSGTNGCSTSGALTYGGNSMVSALMDEFSEDVARGDGEALTAVAVSLGVTEEDRPVFKQVMHDNFSTMFPSDQVTAEEVTASIISLMSDDTVLSKYVS